MGKLNLDLTNTAATHVITDELKADVGSAAFYLIHDRFYGSTDLEIWTGVGKTGTQLIEMVDYIIGGKDIELSDRAVASVYSYVTVVNVTYQTGNLYFNYHVCADIVDAEDRYTVVAPVDEDISLTTSGTGKLVIVGDATISGSLTLVNEITEFSTDGTLGDDSDDAVPTEKAVKKYGDDNFFLISNHTKAIHDALGLDHGDTTGKDDDDHTHYHNDTRGDVRYLYKENVAAFTPDGDYEPATKKYVDDAISGVASEEFVGIVKMYNGTGLDTPDTRTEAVGFREGDTVPERPGWYVCNGQSSTPDLRNKFIRCESASGNTGGSDDAIVVAHTHTTAGSSAANTGYTAPNHRHSYTRYSSLVISITTSGTVGWYSTSGKNTGYYAPNHRHSMAHTHNVNSSGALGTGANKPAYYSLIFIIKMS